MTLGAPSIDRDDIDAALVGRLVAGQFPRWAHLPVRPVAVSGWDNRTFRLGDEMSVRLPSAERYVAQVTKEHRWLPRLAPHLPLSIPMPLAMGEPTSEYPWPWSVYRWLSGTTAAVDRISDLSRFGTDLGEFLVALRGIDPTSGPRPGHRQILRVGRLQTQDTEMRRAIDLVKNEIDASLALDVWNAALDAPEHRTPTWIHGDLTPNNLLVDDGRLAAVIDFGCSGVGDPAIDLEIAWGEFGECRDAFRANAQVDDATWARARGWKLWGSVRGLAEGLRTDADWVEGSRRVIEEVLNDHENAA